MVKLFHKQLSPFPFLAAMGAMGGGGGGGGGGMGGMMQQAPQPDPASLVLGGIQTIAALKGLKKIGGLNPYLAGPELTNAYNRAEGMANTGYTPEEVAAFQGNMARSNQLGLSRGLAMSGGNLAQALNVASTTQNIPALNQFASSDAALHRNNIRYADTLAQAMQHQRGLQTQNLNRERDLKMAAYGGALKAGLENVTNGLNKNAAKNYQPNGDMGAGGGGGDMGAYSGANFQMTPNAQPINSGLFAAPGGGGYQDYVPPSGGSYG